MAIEKELRILQRNFGHRSASKGPEAIGTVLQAGYSARLDNPGGFFQNRHRRTKSENWRRLLSAMQPLIPCLKIFPRCDPNSKPLWPAAFPRHLRFAIASFSRPFPRASPKSTPWREACRAAG